MRLRVRQVAALWLGIGTAACGGDPLTSNQQDAAKCAEIVNGAWAGDLDGATLSLRLTYVGALGCSKGGTGALNTVDNDWSWKGFQGGDQYTSGNFIYRPDSPAPDSISLRLHPSTSCSSVDSRVEAYFAEPDRLEGTVTLRLSEPDSSGICSESPIVDLREVPVELTRAAGG